MTRRVQVNNQDLQNRLKFLFKKYSAQDPQDSGKQPSANYNHNSQFYTCDACATNACYSCYRSYFHESTYFSCVRCDLLIPPDKVELICRPENYRIFVGEPNKVIYNTYIIPGYIMYRFLMLFSYFS